MKDTSVPEGMHIPVKYTRGPTLLVWTLSIGTPPSESANGLADRAGGLNTKA